MSGGYTKVLALQSSSSTYKGHHGLVELTDEQSSLEGSNLVLQDIVDALPSRTVAPSSVMSCKASLFKFLKIGNSR